MALGVVLLTVCTSVITTSLVGRKTDKGDTSAAEETSRPTSVASMSTVEAMPTDFTVAAEKSVESVVHVKVKMKIEQGYTGIDPEVPITVDASGVATSGIDRDVYPRSMTVLCGLSLSF